MKVGYHLLLLLVGISLVASHLSPTPPVEVATSEVPVKTITIDGVRLGMDESRVKALGYRKASPGCQCLVSSPDGSMRVFIAGGVAMGCRNGSVLRCPNGVIRRGDRAAQVKAVLGDSERGEFYCSGYLRVSVKEGKVERIDLGADH